MDSFTAICLAFFPPSETFFPYLLGFIQKHRDPNLDFHDSGRWPLHVQVSYSSHQTCFVGLHIKITVQIENVAGSLLIT